MPGFKAPASDIEKETFKAPASDIEADNTAEKKNGEQSSVAPSDKSAVSSLQSFGSDLSSKLNLPASSSTSGSVPGESPEYTAFKKASQPTDNVEQLKAKVKEHILGDDNSLLTQQGIDAYAKELRKKYSDADVQQVKDYAQKVSANAPEFKKLQGYVQGNLDEEGKPIPEPNLTLAPPEVKKQVTADLNAKKKAQSQDRDAFVRLGGLATEHDDPQSAIAYFNKAMTLEQKQGVGAQETISLGGQRVASADVNILNGLGFAHSKMGDDKQAAQYYQEAIKADPHDDTGFAKKRLAAIKLKHGDVAGAQDLLMQAQDDESGLTIPLSIAGPNAPHRMTTALWEEQGQKFRYEKAHENDTRDYLNGIANGLASMVAGISPTTAIQEGFEGGMETLKKADESLATGNTGTAVLQMGQGVLQMAMGVASVTPEGALFNLSANGASSVLPEKLSKVLMQPYSSVQDFFDANPSDAQKAIAAGGDLIVQGLILHGMHTGLKGVSELAEKFKKNEPLTPVDVALFQKTVQLIPESTIAEAARKVFGKGSQLDDDKLTALTEKKDALVEAHKTAKTDYAKNIISNEIAELDTKIIDRVKEVIKGHHEDGLKATEEANRKIELDAAEKALEDAKKEGNKVTQAIFEKKVAALQPVIEEPKVTLEINGEPITDRTNLIPHPESEADVAGTANTDDHLNPEIANDKLTAKGEEEAGKLNLKKFTKVNTSDNERAIKTGELAQTSVTPEKLKIEGEAENLLNTLDMKADEGKSEISEMEAKAINGPDGEPFKKRMEKLWEHLKGKDDEAFITHNKVKRAIESLDKTDGKWTDKTTEEFLKSNDLKPKEDAVPIESTAKVDVQPEASNGEKVGEGNTKHQEPTGEGESKGGKTQEVSKNDKEKVENTGNSNKKSVNSNTEAVGEDYEIPGKNTKLNYKSNEEPITESISSIGDNTEQRVTRTGIGEGTDNIGSGHDTGAVGELAQKEQRIEYNDRQYSVKEIISDGQKTIHFENNAGEAITPRNSQYKHLLKEYERVTGEDKFVAKFINSGMLEAKGEAQRMDLFGIIEPKDIPDAIAQIKKGGKLSADAKRLRDAIIKARETGQIPMMEGVGGKRRTWNQDLKDFKESLDNSKDTFEKEESEPKPFKEQKTGIKNAIVEKERQAQYKGLLDKDFMDHSDEAVMNRAFELIDKGWDPRAHAQEFADNPQTMTAEQQAAFMIDRVKIQNEITDIDNQINEVRGLDPQLESDLRMQRAELDNVLDLNDRAVTYAGTKLSAAFRIRQVVMGHDFSIERLRKNWFHDNPTEKTMPKEIKERLAGYEKKVNELKSQLAESQEKLKAEQEKRSVENIKEDVERGKEIEKKNAPDRAKKIKEATSKISAAIRRGKIIRPDVFSASVGAKIWDTALEIVAKTIDASGTIAEAVENGLQAIKNSAWYKELDKKIQAKAEKQWHETWMKESIEYAAPFKEEERIAKEKSKAEKSEKQKEKQVQFEIQARVRELVDSGVTDMNELVKKIHSEMVNEKPDLTERQVRDEITGYGKQVNVGKDELTTQINRMKRIGVLISKTEDVLNGERPKRKLIDKDKPTDQERAMTRNLNELMKELPPDETEDYRKLKSATDAKVTRLTNQIVDLNKHVEDLRAGREPEKTTKKAIISTPEIIDLEKQRNDLQNEIEALNGKQELTDKEYLDKWKENARKQQAKYEEKIANKDYSVKPKRELVHDKESADILAKLETVKKQYRAEREADKKANYTKYQKALETWSMLKKFNVLLGTAVFGKIGVFSGVSLLAEIPEAIAGKALSMIPGIGAVMKYAPMHGAGAFVTPLVKMWAEFLNPKKLFKNSKDIFMKGQTELGSKFNPHVPEYVPEKVIGLWGELNTALEIPGRFHAMVHDPLIRARYESTYEKLNQYYTKAFQENMQKAIDKGENPTEPHFIMAMQSMAYADALNSSLLGKNWVSDMWNNSINRLEQKKSAGAKFSATLMKVAVPITTVPANFVNSALDYSGIGLVKAAANLVHGVSTAAKESQSSFMAELIYNGVKNMPKEDREAFSKHLKKGTVGAALMMIGYNQADQIDPKHHKFYGVELPKWFHTPLLSPLEIGAMWKRANLSKALVSQGKTELKNIPMFEAEGRFMDAWKDDKAMMQYVADFAKSTTIPVPLQKLLPTYAKPQTLMKAYTTQKPHKVH